MIESRMSVNEWDNFTDRTDQLKLHSMSGHMISFWQRDVRSFSLSHDVQAVLPSLLFNNFQLARVIVEKIVEKLYIVCFIVNKFYVVYDGQKEAIFLDIGLIQINYLIYGLI